MASKKDSWLAKNMFSVAIIAIIAIIIAGALSYSYLAKPYNGPSDREVVTVGSYVTVDYIGEFEDGKVFDTSIENISKDDVSYPKALSFSTRAEGQYTPLSFKVGEHKVVEGFENGVIGMEEGEWKTITIPPSKGYGDKDPSLMKTVSMIESYPIYENIGNKSEFYETFGIGAKEGLRFFESPWGWNATVYNIDPGTNEITVKREVVLGEHVRTAYPWDAEVISIDDSTAKGNITIRHVISDEDLNNTMGKDTDGSEYFLVGLDKNAETFTIDYNKEVVGKTLVFDVKIVSIDKYSIKDLG